MTVADRLLILAPVGRDAQVIAGQLGGMQPEPMIATAAEIVQAVGAGELAAAVITDEAFAEFDLAELAAALAAQPPWSDSPFIILTKREFGGWTRAQLASLLGNQTILERPLVSDVLISSVRSALRARARQRRTLGYLLAVETADAQVRELAATLETRVNDRTAALSEAMVAAAESERRLRDSEELYRYTVELSGQTPWTANASGSLPCIARGWANPTGDTASLMSLVHPEDLNRLEAAWAISRDSGTPFLHDFRIRGADGNYRWCRSRAAARRADDGSAVHWYGTLEDINEQRLGAIELARIQAELIHVSRLSAIGAMASTLAHELNQPLTAITNYIRGSRRLLAGHPDFQKVSEALEMTDRSAVRASEIIRRVRELVAKGDVSRQPEDLAELVREACGLAMIDADSSGIEICLDLAGPPTTVLVDRIQIQQVLLNLLRNAAEAVSGSLKRRITVSITAVAGNFSEVIVSDTGTGLAAAAGERLFEPFNTTKNNGMGIGLSISRTIIEAHGGVIWYRPGATGGAVFGFSLVRDPIAPATPPQIRAPVATSA